MKPQYTLAPVVKQKEVDPGEVAIIDFFISGHGAIDQNKFVVINSNDHLLDEEPGQIDYLLRTGVRAGNQNFIESEPHFDRLELSKVGTHTMLDPRYFSDNPNWIEHADYDENEDAEGIPLKIGETAIKGDPPFRLRLNISEKASPGDYILPMILTYAIDEKVYQDRQDVTIHVNNRREQWEPWPTIAGLAAAVIALLALLINTADILL